MCNEFNMEVEIDYIATDMYKRYWKYDWSTFYDPSDPFHNGLSADQNIRVEDSKKNNSYKLKKSPSEIFNEKHNDESKKMRNCIDEFRNWYFRDME